MYDELGKLGEKKLLDAGAEATLQTGLADEADVEEAEDEELREDIGDVVQDGSVCVSDGIS